MTLEARSVRAADHLVDLPVALGTTHVFDVPGVSCARGGAKLIEIPLDHTNPAPGKRLT